MNGQAEKDPRYSTEEYVEFFKQGKEKLDENDSIVYVVRYCLSRSSDIQHGRPACSHQRRNVCEQ